MRRNPLLTLTAALALALAAPLAAAGPAFAASSHPQMIPRIIEETNCVGIVSHGGWHATICAMINFDDAAGDVPSQALVTFSVRSGGIRNIFAGAVYLDVNGKTENYISNPDKYPGGASSTYVSTAWNWNQIGEWRAVIENPCIIWTNGQEACYNAVLTSFWTRGF